VYKIFRTAFETFRKHANLPDVAGRFQAIRLEVRLQEIFGYVGR
jgi:hypothetical protein